MAPRRTDTGPRASVVMPVHNDMRFLDEAIDSVLGQDMDDLELIVVDDGSDDASAFGGLEQRDPRIRLLTNPVNVGLSASANRAIDAARSDVIVRLDADDVCEPHRIGRLVAALDDDPALGLVGSAVTLIDEGGTVCGAQQMPESDLEIRFTMLFHTPFFHPAVAFRRACFEEAGRYDATKLVAQDYWLWAAMLRVTQARNLPQRLTRYRLNSKGITSTHAGPQARARTNPIRERLWAELGLMYDLYDDELAAGISAFLRGQTTGDDDRRAAVRSVVERALGAFTEHYGAEELRGRLLQRLDRG